MKLKHHYAHGLPCSAVAWQSGLCAVPSSVGGHNNSFPWFPIASMQMSHLISRPWNHQWNSKFPWQGQRNHSGNGTIPQWLSSPAKACTLHCMFTTTAEEIALSTIVLFSLSR
jgi:hypothetical protein